MNATTTPIALARDDVVTFPYDVIIHPFTPFPQALTYVVIKGFGVDYIAPVFSLWVLLHLLFFSVSEQATDSDRSHAVYWCDKPTYLRPKYDPFLSCLGLEMVPASLSTVSTFYRVGLKGTEAHFEDPAVTSSLY